MTPLPKGSEVRVYGASWLLEAQEAPKFENQWNNVSKWSWAPHDPEGVETLKGHADALVESWDCAALTNYRPGPNTQSVVLIFDLGLLKHDFVNWCRRLGLKFFYLSYDQFVSQGSVQYELGDPSEVVRFTLADAELDLRDVRAVVWNPPWPMIDFQPPARPTVHEDLFVKRWSQVLRELRGLLSERVIWLPSHPLNGSQEWQHRLSEYRIAQSLGLAIPPTLFTNSSSEAAVFVKKHGDVIFREFSIAPYSARGVMLPARTKSFPDLNRAPCVFQKYIDKEFEARVVIVGDRLFAASIDSQASDSTKLDWRVHDNERVAWKTFRLPVDLEERIILLAKKLGLAWASVDLIKATDGHFYFLEINRPGACFWLKPFVGIDVAKQIALFLSENIDS